MKSTFKSILLFVLFIVLFVFVMDKNPDRFKTKNIQSTSFNNQNAESDEFMLNLKESTTSIKPAPAILIMP